MVLNHSLQLLFPGKANIILKLLLQIFLFLKPFLPFNYAYITFKPKLKFENALKFLTGMFKTHV